MAEREIIERLRRNAEFQLEHHMGNNLLLEQAADVIEELDALVARYEAALRVIGLPSGPGIERQNPRLLAEWWQHTACKRGELARQALGVSAENLIREDLARNAVEYVG